MNSKDVVKHLIVSFDYILIICDSIRWCKDEVDS